MAKEIYRVVPSWCWRTRRRGFTSLLPILGILRKEVIQPHLPIRLPCYDLVPLTPHSLDGSLLLRG